MSPTRRDAAIALLVAAAGATLIFGWSYASYREARTKELWIRGREAAGEDMSGERVYMQRHELVEGAGIAGLALLFVAAGVATLRAARRSRELAAQKTAFVTAVTHELRTPLTTLRMHAEMLRDGLVADDRRARVHEELAAQAERLGRLVDDVLALAKLDEGRWEPARAVGDLGAAVGALLDELEPGVAAAGFVLTRELDDAVVAAFDPRALELIVKNLVDNALKHGRGDGELAVVVAVRRERESAVLSVRDRGPGIAEEQRAAVFERFRRGPRGAGAPGVGVGLALVRELAHAHGGEARALPSELGAHFEVRLPAAAFTKP